MLLVIGVRASTMLPVWVHVSAIPPAVELVLLAVSTLWTFRIEDRPTALCAGDLVAACTRCEPRWCGHISGGLPRKCVAHVAMLCWESSIFWSHILMTREVCVRRWEWNFFCGDHEAEF